MAKKPPPKKHKPIQSLLRRMIESLPQPPQAKPVTRRVSINRLTDPDIFEQPDSWERKTAEELKKDVFTVKTMIYANSEKDTWVNELSGFFSKAGIPYRIVIDSQNKLFSFVDTQTGNSKIGTDTAFKMDTHNQVLVKFNKIKYRLFINYEEVFDNEKTVRVKLSGLPHNEDRYDFQSLISS